MSVTVFGIPNCDTVKKARKWLEARDIDYSFVNFKTEGADPAKVQAWVADKGWEVVLNRRGTTFRQLHDEDKADLDADKATRLMEGNPSMIKRPVVEYPGGVLVGFSEDEWAAAFN